MGARKKCAHFLELKIVQKVILEKLKLKKYSFKNRKLIMRILNYKKFFSKQIVPKLFEHLRICPDENPLQK